MFVVWVDELSEGLGGIRSVVFFFEFEFGKKKKNTHQPDVIVNFHLIIICKYFSFF